ncbi:MAG: hypothetical protein SVY15_06825 [Halobacteriota archaeon]|nr:hypothetical protein [Halobacteriota archaeon]
MTIVLIAIIICGSVFIVSSYSSNDQKSMAGTDQMYLIKSKEFKRVVDGTEYIIVEYIIVADRFHSITGLVVAKEEYKRHKPHALGDELWENYFFKSEVKPPFPTRWLSVFTLSQRFILSSNLFSAHLSFTISLFLRTCLST